MCSSDLWVGGATTCCWRSSKDLKEGMVRKEGRSEGLYRECGRHTLWAPSMDSWPWNLDSSLPAATDSHDVKDPAPQVDDAGCGLGPREVWVRAP